MAAGLAGGRSVCRHGRLFQTKVLRAGGIPLSFRTGAACRPSQGLGYSFDWDREINTTDPNYYHWTQWIFLKLFNAGLAYKSEMPINWCTSCKVGLANEEVVNGVCERCGAPVVRKVKSQWMLKITEYADKLIDGLEGLD